MCAAGVAHRGRVGDGPGATSAGTEAASAAAARVAVAVAWQAVTVVAAVGGDGTVGVIAGDFWVSKGACRCETVEWVETLFL